MLSSPGIGYGSDRVVREIFWVLLGRSLDGAEDREGRDGGMSGVVGVVCGAMGLFCGKRGRTRALRGSSLVLLALLSAACTSVLNAIADALGDDEAFARSPVLVDHLVTALDTKKMGQVPLTANV